MKEPGRTAAKNRLKEEFRVQLAREFPTIERLYNARGPVLSRAEVLRAIKCNIAECVACAVRNDRILGETTETELVQVSVEAFNEVLEEMAVRATQ